jgi:chromosomal replication initiation ATPase DnaA
MNADVETEGHCALAWRGAAGLPDEAPLTNAELVQLRIRVIALENLVIALLAEATDRQLELARGMASHISPRAGFTPHPITLRAADEMLSLVDRADRYLRPSRR